MGKSQGLAKPTMDDGVLLKRLAVEIFKEMLDMIGIIEKGREGFEERNRTVEHNGFQIDHINHMGPRASGGHCRLRTGICSTANADF
jgi:hypothetical protein